MITNTTPDGSDRHARSLAALGVAGVSLAVVGGAWVARAPLAQAVLEAAFRAQGVPADLPVRKVALSEIVISPLTLGEKGAGISAARARIGLRWRGLLPEVAVVEVDRPRLRVAIEKDGAVRAGGLERLLERVQPGRAPAPRLIVRGADAALTTPFGALLVQGDGEGVPGERFNLDARWRFGALAGPLTVETTPAGTQVRVEGGAAALALEELLARDARLSLALQQKAGSEAWTGVLQARAEAFTAPGVAAGPLAARLEGRGEGLASWRATLQAEAKALRAAGAGAAALTLEAALTGAGGKAKGEWALAALDVQAGPAGAARIAAAGPIEAALSGALSGAARVQAEGLRADVGLARQAALAPAGPLRPLLTQGAQAIDRALRQAGGEAALRFAHASDGWRVSLAEPIRLFAASGAQARFTPAASGVALTADGAVRGAGTLTLQGGGLPAASLAVGGFERDPAGAWSVQATVEAALQAGADQVRLAPTRIAGSGTLRAGTLSLAGGGVAAQAQGWRLAAPLEVVLGFGETVRVALPGEGCLRLEAAADTAAVRLDPLTLRLCQQGEALFAQQNGEAARGGFVLRPVQLAGAVSGEALRGRLAALSGRFRGTQPSLTLAARGLAVEVGADVELEIAQAQAQAALSGEAASGSLAGLAVQAGQAPSALREGALRWRLTGDGLRIEDGGGLLLARPEAGQEFPLHEPLRLRALQATLEDGVLTGAVQAVLAGSGADLGAARFTHALASGAGRLDYDSGRILFGTGLQPYDVTRRLLGVADLARGPIALEAAAEWGPGGLATSGALRLEKLSFATLALGPVAGVEGVLVFDDLALLTTPPGQVLKIGEINPGVAVRNGVLRLQVKPDLTVSLEDARFPYAGGVLSVDPTILRFNGEETRLLLRLTNVDLAALLAEMELQNQISATGVVTGEFPLLFTPSGGRIEGGRLSAVKPGLIAVQSAAVDEAAAGAASTSAGFLQALQGFRYEELALVSLNGDLAGDLTAELRFTGENIAPVEVPALGGSQRLVGLPFRFNVRVRAPISGLVRGAQQAFDFRSALSGAADAADATPKSPVPPR